MTDLLYQNDSYIREFEGTVLKIDSDLNGVVLDRTAFYPGGGGQPFDTGDLIVDGTSFPVVKIARQGKEIVHVLSKQVDASLTGETAHGTISWDRRYKLMKTHTALHILCGVVFRDYGALVTGGDMEPGKGRMDFEFERMQRELVAAIEIAVNLEVKNARDVRTSILPRKEAFEIPDLIRTRINLLPEGIKDVRTVQIVGLDLQADGGTHVRNTAEVGQIRIVDYKSKGAINKRIYIELSE